MDRYGYPALLAIFATGLLASVLSPSHRSYVELGCYFGTGLYFIAAVTTFSIMQSGSNLYTVANTLQWMPILYIVAFIFFEKKRAIFAGLSVFLLSILAPLAVFATKGGQFWDVPLGALLINGYAVHLMVLLTLSLFIMLKDQFVQASELARKMESTAHTDQLTSIPNRRGLEAILDRYGEAPTQPVTLILLDIDHFKRVNDQFGHLTGDDVLCSTAKLIKRQLRPTDAIGRWGGEEFLIIAPDTDLQAGMSLADHLRRTVNASIHSVVGPVSFSAGLAVWADGRTLRDTLHLADRSLYEAKRQGRNRVEALDILTGRTFGNVISLSRLH
ncbi:GGDEF domain-containing protein [Microvirga aerilata]